MKTAVCLIALMLTSSTQAQYRPRSPEDVALRAILLLTQQAGGELIIKDHGQTISGEVDVFWTPTEIKITIGRKS